MGRKIRSGRGQDAESDCKKDQPVQTYQLLEFLQMVLCGMLVVAFLIIKIREARTRNWLGTESFALQDYRNTTRQEE